VITWELRLHDNDGARVATFDIWPELRVEVGVNRPAVYSLRLDGDDPRTALFEQDGILEGWKKPEEAPAGETWAIWALDHARYAGIAAGDYVTLKLLREGGNANDTVNDSVYLKGWLVSYTADM
jgi:hypothetical protein